jgi:hypothetical protein
MEPEPDRIDLAVLDPARDAVRFDATVARIASRALELRCLRRAVVRRGALAFAVAMAAALVLWFSAPRRATPPPRATSPDLLDWATRDVGANDVLDLGGSHAQ